MEAVILEDPIAKGYASNNTSIAIADLDLVSENTDAYAIALPKGNNELKEPVNKVVKELGASGQYDHWVQEAFEQSISNSQ